MTDKRPGVWNYTLLFDKELSIYCQVGRWRNFGFICRENEEDIPILQWQEIRQQLEKDLDATTVFGNDRLNWLVACIAVYFKGRNVLEHQLGTKAIRSIDLYAESAEIASILGHYLGNANLLAQIRAGVRMAYQALDGAQDGVVNRMVERSRLLDRTRIVVLAISMFRDARSDLHASLERNHKRDPHNTSLHFRGVCNRLRELALPRIIDPSSRNIADLFGYALDIDINSDLRRAFERNRDPSADRNLNRAFNRVRTLISDFGVDTKTNLNRDLTLCTFVLNWLCVIEKRTRGELPAADGLWITRDRKYVGSTNDFGRQIPYQSAEQKARDVEA
ncbi:MAG: hypothetical protein ACJ8LM_16610 [Candidatus Udaeobacter sp.]